MKIKNMLLHYTAYWPAGDSFVNGHWKYDGKACCTLNINMSME